MPATAYPSLEGLLGGSILQSAVTWLQGYATPQRVLTPASQARVYIVQRGAADTSAPNQEPVFPNSDGSGTPLVQPLQPDVDGRLPGYVYGPKALDAHISAPGLAARVVSIGLNLPVAVTTDRGAWASGQTYQVHDLVEYGGATWVCAVAHTSGATFDDTKWTELVQFRGAWQPNTRYEAGDTVVQGGQLYFALVAFTSAGSFNPANWSSSLASALLKASNLSDVASPTAARGNLGAAQDTAPTAILTGAQNIAAGQQLRLDISGGGGIGTLPNAPADGTRCAIKVVKVNATPGTYAATLLCAGADTFSGGATSVAMQALGEGRVVQYRAADHTWTTISTDSPFSTGLGAARLGSDGRVGGAGGDSLALSVVSGGSVAVPMGASTTFLPLPTGVAATDTANLNTVLARGGRIRPNPLALTAAYSLSASLVLAPGGNTDVDFGGCTFNLSGQFNMLQNGAVAATYTATDASTTAGSSVVTSATLAAHAAPGMQLAVVGAGAVGGNTPGSPGPIWLYGTVASVSGNNITLTGNYNGVAAQISGSGQTAYLWTARDANVRIEGGIWNSGTTWNTLATRQTAAHNSSLLRFRRIDGLTLRHITVAATSFPQSGGWAFGIDLADITSFLVDTPIGAGASTTVQGTGPLTRGTVRNARGQTQDDMVALGCVGAAGYDTEGDVIDIEVQGVQSNGGLRCINLFAGAGANAAARIMEVAARSLKGTTVLSPVNLGDYAGESQINVTIEDVTAASASASNPTVVSTASSAQAITLRGIRWSYLASPPTNGVISIQAAAVSVTVEDLDLRAVSGSPWVGVSITGSGNIASLVVDGVQQPDNGSGWAIVKLGGSGVIGYLSVKRFKVTGGTTTVVWNASPQGVNTVNIQDGSQNCATGGSLYFGSAGGIAAPQLFVSNVTSATAGATIQTGHQLAVYIQNLWVNPGAGNPVIAAVGANATPVGVFATNLWTNASGAKLITRDGTQSLSGTVMLSNAGVDISTLTPGDGSVFNNSNATAAPLGPVVYGAGTGQWSRLNAPGDLAYAQIVANQSGISAEADVTGLSVTFTAPASGSVWLEAWVYSFQQAGGVAGIPTLYIADNTNAHKGQALAGNLTAAGNFSPSVLARVKVTGLTPGTSYTYKVRASDSAGSAVLYAATTNPAYLRATAA